MRPYESVRAVGYGRSDVTDLLGRRLRRDDIDVLAVGARLTASSTASAIASSRSVARFARADSGGPSIAANTGAVVLVSRADCRRDYGHVYTQTSGFEALFARALKLAGSTLTNEEGLALSSTDLGGADGAGATSDIEGGVAASLARAARLTAPSRLPSRASRRGSGAANVRGSAWPRGYFAFAQFGPAPASTTSGTFSFMALAMTSLTFAIASRTLLSGTSNTSSS